MNEVLHIDCLIGIQNIPDKSIDMIVADPPYGINLKKGYKTGESLVNGDDGFSVMFFLDNILKQLQRVLKPNAACYVFTRFDVMPYWFLKCKDYFTIKNCLIWSKGGGGTGDLEGSYIQNYEMVLFMVKGRHLLNGKRNGSVIDFKKCNLEYHETQKPIDLIQYLIEKSSKENDLILDPFAGSGTTAIACMNTNRNYILMEKEEKYYNIIKDRIKKHTPQLKLIA